MAGISATFQHLGLWVQTDQGHGAPQLAVRRFVHIWEFTSGKWNALGIFLTNWNGELFNVENDVRQEYKDSTSSTNSGTAENQSAVFLKARGPEASVPDPKKHQAFSPDPAKEYFFCFLPLDLLLRPGYRGNHDAVKAWAEKNEKLLKEPPKHWLDAVGFYGLRTRITEKELSSGIVLPLNWCEWLRKLAETLDRIEWFTAYTTAHKKPYLEATVYLDTIGEMLEATAKFESDKEIARGPIAMSRDYGLYHLDMFSQLIHQEYLSNKVLQKEQQKFFQFAQEVMQVLNDKSFKQSFLFYSLADRLCDGKTAYSMQSQGNSAIELDPVNFLNPERVDQIICAAFAATMFDPTDNLVRMFYEQNVLPVELQIADTLDDDDREAIKKLFNDPKLEEQFLSGCTPDQKKVLEEAIAAGCEKLSSAGYITSIEKTQPGIRKAIKDMEPKNEVWNWIKESGKETIDNFLGTFLTMRESWATDSFGKQPKLKASYVESIQKSVFLLKVTTAGFKVYQKKAGGTTGAVIKRSVKDYLGDVKTRMCSKERWITDENGKRFGGTPQNLNMAFSAIGVIVSIQGIYSFGQKCVSGKKPEIDDYVDLYKSLSSGVSSVLGLLPEGAVDSHLVTALGRVFVPLTVACDLNSAIKLVKKSQLYFAQHEFDQSMYAALRASMKFGSMGFSIASLFRTKALTTFLLKRETLLGGGSRMLSFTFSFAMIGCDLFSMYLKAIEPEGSKLAKAWLSKLDELINDDPRKELDTIKETVNGTSFNVPKINYWEPDLSWKDSRTFRGKEIYCDQSKNWNWLDLRKLINDELTGVPPLLGVGWVREFDKEKALFELLDRGVDADAVAKICKKSKEEVENTYRRRVREQQGLINQAKEIIRDPLKREEAVIQALS
jgi:hypothetical protein